MWVCCVKENMEKRDTIRKGEKREHKPEMTRSYPCSLLVSEFPGAATYIFILCRMQFQSGWIYKDLRHCFLNRTWWLFLLAKGGKQGSWCLNNQLMQTRRKQVSSSCLNEDGEPKNWWLDPEFISEGAELRPHQTYLSALVRPWGGSPKTVCWDEPG